MDFFEKYPELEKKFMVLCQNRRDEILSYMIETDSKYENLRCERADASIALREALDSITADMLFETYSDAIYAQETYELDVIYKQAFHDALRALLELGLLQ